MSSLDELRWTFFLECADLLEALDDGFDNLSESEDGCELDLEEVNAVFRAVHSIKGGAASFALEDLVRFAHEFETVLDAMRAGRLAPSREDWRVLRQSGDVLAELVSAARDGSEFDGARHVEVGYALRALIGGEAGDTQNNPKEQALFGPTPIALGENLSQEASFEPVMLAVGDQADAPSMMVSTLPPMGAHAFAIKFSARPTLFKNGHDPVHLFRELSELGALDVTVDLSDLSNDPDSTKCHLKWRLELVAECDEEDIREVFEFVEPLAEIQIEHIKFSNSSGKSLQAEEEPSDQSDRGTAQGYTKPQNDFSDLKLDLPPPDSSKGSSSANKNETKISKETATALPVAAQASQSAKSRKSTVRVDLGLVDDLINIVGELVINQSFLSQSIADAGLSAQPHLTAGLDEFKNLARQIQEGVMAIRAQSVKPLFQRMARIVREASAVAGKPVRFETFGEATEVDTTVIERLIDPLTHILRNAVDHGLEDPEARLVAEKPPEGVVRLSADHRSGRVLIEVSDDGGGINRPKVLAIAKDKGLVAADASLPDEEVDRLLFQPGFSTAETVTDLSGRGVGMDVVRSAIQKLGGRINITSTPGRGTTISISLPLTLAVLEGMVVKVVGQTMVIPINAVVETLRPRPDEIEPLTEGAEVVRVRDRLVPIVDLGVVFGYNRTRKAEEDRVLLLVETEQGRHWALSVDEIRDQRQVVIKSLEENYGRVPGVAAATILGDGRIALIIDPEEAIRTATEAERLPTVLHSDAPKNVEAQHAGA